MNASLSRPKAPCRSGLKRTALCSAAALAVLITLSLKSATYAQDVVQVSPLSGQTSAAHLRPQTLFQIQMLEREEDTRTPAQQKLDSKLWYSAKMKAGTEIAPNVPTLQTGITEDADGLVLVDITADVTDTVLAQIEADGGQIISSYPEYKAIRARLPISQLEKLAGLSGVKFIQPAAIPLVQGRPVNVGTGRLRGAQLHPLVPAGPGLIGFAQRAKSVRAHLPSLLRSQLSRQVRPITPRTGSVDSEGDTTHRAALARSTFHADGTGIKIGVMSDSDDFLENSQSSGDLPSNVTVLSGQSGRPGSGEGTAMMEIVHDIAPGASIYFATGGGGEANLASNIKALYNAGCQIIVDDISYPAESPFQDDIPAQAVQYVTAHGVIYFSSADNFGNFDDQTSSCWIGDFVDSGATVSGTDGGKVAQFGTLDSEPIIENTITDKSGNGQDPVLFWSDPLGKSTNDYNLFVLDSDGDIVDASTNVQNGTQNPYESLTGVPGGDSLVIVLHSGSACFLHLDLASQNGLLSSYSNQRTRGHATVNAVGAYGVAATPAYKPTSNYGKPTGPYPDPFNSSNLVEYFSSDGPSHQFYNTDGSAITPGNFLHTGGAFVDKPDITAADGVTTSLTSTVTGGESFAPFFGTSAAAPHAAAITALLLSYAPSLTQAQVRSLLTSTAIDIMASGWDRDSGYGILDAYALLNAAPATTVPTITSFTPTSGGTGTVVTVTGTGFTGATGVTLHGVSVSYTVKSSTTLTVTVSSSVPTGAGHIDVTTPGGTASSPHNFTVTASAPAPTITSFTPTRRGVGKTVVITGTNFTGATAVKFNGTAATTFSIDSATQITATIPTGATSGTISVTTPGGTATSSSVFTVLPPAPTITSFTPTSGPVGTSVTITGTSFSGATGVTFHSTTATTFSVVSDTQIKATVPSGATTGTIAVTNDGGTATSASSFTVTASAPTPTITSFTPTSGPVGTVVTVTGTGFTGATGVTLHGVSVSYTVKSSTTLTVTVSSSVPTGAGHIDVTTPGGTASSPHNFTVTTSSGTVKPSALTFNPNPGFSSGETIGTVTLTGAAPSGGAAVTISTGGSVLLTATVPAGQTSTTFSLLLPNVTSTQTYTFTAAYNSNSITATLTVDTTSVTLSSFLLSPSPASSNETLTGQVTLSANAPAGGAVVTISQNGSSLGYVLVAAGSKTQSFTLSAPTVTTSTVFTYAAAYNGATKSVQETVKP